MTTAGDRFLDESVALICTPPACAGSEVSEKPINLMLITCEEAFLSIGKDVRSGI